VNPRRLLRPGVRLTQRIAVVSIAITASALAEAPTQVAMSTPTTIAFSASGLNDVEAPLVRAIVGLRELGLKSALGEIDKVLEHSPNFRLAHLIKGDLLMARAGKPGVLAARAAPSENLSDLRDEARVRVHRYVDGPRTDYLPAPLLQLAPSQAHAILVDTSRSRLFVYANDLGRPRYVTDFYISLGKNGVEKSREGDQKTPLGIYTIGALMGKLPNIYGAGAYPLSYPNEWDKLHGRNGHGIWIHGTPAEMYSRPPRATDGCVVLTNEDLARIAKYVDVSRTPVVIGQGVEWRAPDAWENERGAVLKAFAGWRTDWESRDTERYLANYSSEFRSSQRNFTAWSASKKRVNSGKSWIKVAATDVSLFAYPGAPNLMMITFEQDYRSNNMSKRTHKRQFWALEGGRWRIVHEAVVS
jgi:murein L,D-transpeptidase YafK